MLHGENKKYYDWLISAQHAKETLGLVDMIPRPHPRRSSRMCSSKCRVAVLNVSKTATDYELTYVQSRNTEYPAIQGDLSKYEIISKELAKSEGFVFGQSTVYVENIDVYNISEEDSNHINITIGFGYTDMHGVKHRIDVRNIPPLEAMKFMTALNEGALISQIKNAPSAGYHKKYNTWRKAASVYLSNRWDDLNVFDKDLWKYLQRKMAHSSIARKIGIVVDSKEQTRFEEAKSSFQTEDDTKKVSSQDFCNMEKYMNSSLTVMVITNRLSEVLIEIFNNVEIGESGELLFQDDDIEKVAEVLLGFIQNSEKIGQVFYNALEIARSKDSNVAKLLPVASVDSTKEGINHEKLLGKMHVFLKKCEANDEEIAKLFPVVASHDKVDIEIGRFFGKVNAHISKCVRVENDGIPIIAIIFTIFFPLFLPFLINTYSPSSVRRIKLHNEHVELDELFQNLDHNSVDELSRRSEEEYGVALSENGLRLYVLCKALQISKDNLIVQLKNRVLKEERKGTGVIQIMEDIFSTNLYEICTILGIEEELMGEHFSDTKLLKYDEKKSHSSKSRSLQEFSNSFRLYKDDSVSVEGEDSVSVEGEGSVSVEGEGSVSVEGEDSVSVEGEDSVSVEGSVKGGAKSTEKSDVKSTKDGAMSSEVFVLGSSGTNLAKSPPMPDWIKQDLESKVKKIQDDDKRQRSNEEPSTKHFESARSRACGSTAKAR